ncbi:MAG: hypothetical protein FJ387_09100 [Verrucomicrobia bacterium]|nr:hypothetical protein [Verrucomicrobiota bacterium]
MSEPSGASNDSALRTLLREARVTPELPLRFQAAVWRRIEQTRAARDWLGPIVSWLWRPRLALAGATALLLFGGSLGLAEGVRLAKENAKERYVAAVSPLNAGN